MDEDEDALSSIEDDDQLLSEALDEAEQPAETPAFIDEDDEADIQLSLLVDADAAVACGAADAEDSNGMDAAPRARPADASINAMEDFMTSSLFGVEGFHNSPARVGAVTLCAI